MLKGQSLDVERNAQMMLHTMKTGFVMTRHEARAANQAFGQAELPDERSPAAFLGAGTFGPSQGALRLKDWVRVATSPGRSCLWNEPDQQKLCTVGSC
jgi:hypothetical protein